MATYAAIDLGATSGRVAVGTVTKDAISFEIVHRFSNDPISDPTDGIMWNWSSLQKQILVGLNRAHEKYSITSVAIDSWGVDYQFLTNENELDSKVFSYRNLRTEGVMEETVGKIGKASIYQRTGIQFLPFNTIYQLVAAAKTNAFESVERFLLLPDALNHFLCGSKSQEVTNASSTQLLDPVTRKWRWDLIDELGLPKRIFPPLHEPGTVLGKITGHGKLDGLPVIAIGSHDTASAIAAVPMIDPDNSIYISSGTWSLVGYESSAANTSNGAFAIDLTNELGVESTVRLLRNVAGMWLLSECQRDWLRQGIQTNVEELIASAREIAPDTFLIDPNDHSFLAAGNMIGRISEYCRVRDFAVPETPAQFTRCILDSLALAYHKVISEFEKVEGCRFEVIYVVGGGSANDFLNQLTANVTGKKVVTGAVESTILGNIGIQAISSGEISSLKQLRQLIAKSITQKEFLP